MHGILEFEVRGNYGCIEIADELKYIFMEMITFRQ